MSLSDEPAPAGAPVSLRSTSFALRPVGPEDYRTLRELDLASDHAARWRLRDATPRPEEWLESLWQNVLAQFISVDRTTGRSLGLVGLYGVNLQDGYGKLSAIKLIDGYAPVFLLSVERFIDYAFHTWPLRKLYLDVDGYNLKQFASGIGRYFEQEGRLRDHRFWARQLWDQYIFSMTRESWAARPRARPTHA